ncbi:putative secreted protein [uncultured Stenotrophomonas sp.]|uniref:Putative secreted protein n=1 Tax=uncultured Stenotrophomonas sp. TaxID=165438 RepID=A0A1Y5Q876_9GAMM|nr:putative secreted protein [uncultured Stenotrophomonas sp.]
MFRSACAGKSRCRVPCFTDGVGAGSQCIVLAGSMEGAEMALLRSWGVLLLAMVSPVSAQQVFKCVDGGAVMYQSMPCEGVTERSWEIAAEPAAPPVVAATRTRDAVVDGAGDRRTRRREPGGARRLPLDACERAKAGRDAAYRKAGLKRGFKLSSHWDNRVHDACW